jgi:hypothetical protein
MPHTHAHHSYRPLCVCVYVRACERFIYKSICAFLALLPVTQSFQRRTTGLKMTAFWDIAPCSLAEDDRRFRRSKHFNFYENRPTRRKIPEGCHLHTRRRENLNSY